MEKLKFLCEYATQSSSKSKKNINRREMMYLLLFDVERLNILPSHVYYYKSIGARDCKPDIFNTGSYYTCTLLNK